MIKGIKLLLLPLILLLALLEACYAALEATATTLWGVARNIPPWFRNAYPYLEWLKQDLADCQDILELGCGSSSPLLKIGAGSRTDAVDIFEPYVRMHSERGDYRKCELANILDMPLGKMHGQYDAVVICDVLEHLPKDKVYEVALFDHIEKIARKRVILFTPNHFVENELVDNDPWQEHVSAWYPEDYRSRGYRVVGSTGLRILLGVGSLPKYRPHKLFQVLALLAQPLMFRYPKIAWHSYAVKETVSPLPTGDIREDK